MHTLLYGEALLTKLFTGNIAAPHRIGIFRGSLMYRDVRCRDSLKIVHDTYGVLSSAFLTEKGFPPYGGFCGKALLLRYGEKSLHSPSKANFERSSV